MGRDGPWRRPPTSYVDDEEANADGYFVFNLLDRDQNAHLDLKEVNHARRVLLEILSSGDADLGDTIGGAGAMLDSGVDENNDAKIIEEEWDDFLRAVYELSGRKRFMEMLKYWRRALLVYIKEDQATEAAARQAAAAKIEEAKKQESKKRKAKDKDANLDRDTAVVKIQSKVRGDQTRARVRARHNSAAKAAPTSKASGKAGEMIRDLEKVKMAQAAGRHFLTVISASEKHGTRADFYMDGKEISFDKTHGDWGRGLQVVTIDPETCKVTSRKVYDLLPAQEKVENARLAQDFEALPHGTFVLAANKGGHGLDGLNKVGVAALRSVGASFDGLGRQEVSYALIACKGCLASAEQSEEGVCVAEAMVSFDEASRAIKIDGAVPRDLAP